MNAGFLIRTVATLTVTAGLGLAGSVAVDADGTPAPSPSSVPSPAPHTLTLAALKARCNTAVQRRLGTLGADDTFVRQSAALTSADQTTLEGQITADQQELTALDRTIQGDTTIAQAHSDCELIVTNYRVYVMEDPKIHEVIAADGITKVNASVATLIPELRTLINNSSLSATIKAQAHSDLNDVTSKVDASHTSISGVTASVINLVPAGWPGNKVDLQSAHQNIRTARTDLAGARADVNHILQLLGE
ncbi:MAG: hypothetical protein WCB51_04965 [Candidatus Dormiibacterota bacterium]